MKKTICSAFFFLCCLPLIFAEKITFSAGSMTGQAGNSSTTTRLEGDAFIQTESMEITADLVELTGDNYSDIKAQGQVKGKNTQSHMDFTCDILEYNRETKVAVLKGNVHLEDTENDVKADAQLIEYDQDADIAVLQINIKLTQKDNVCTGAYAVYQKKEQMLVLSGNAQVKQGSDTFRAQQITLNMDTQDITLEGNVKGSVTTEGGNKEAEPEKEETVSENVVAAETEEEKSAEPQENPASENTETVENTKSDENADVIDNKTEETPSKQKKEKKSKKKKGD